MITQTTTPQISNLSHIHTQSNSPLPQTTRHFDNYLLAHQSDQQPTEVSSTTVISDQTLSRLLTNFREGNYIEKTSDYWPNLAKAYFNVEQATVIQTQDQQGRKIEALFVEDIDGVLIIPTKINNKPVQSPKQKLNIYYANEHGDIGMVDKMPLVSTDEYHQTMTLIKRYKLTEISDVLLRTQLPQHDGAKVMTINELSTKIEQMKNKVAADHFLPYYITTELQKRIPKHNLQTVGNEFLSFLQLQYQINKSVRAHYPKTAWKSANTGIWVALPEGRTNAIQLEQTIQTVYNDDEHQKRIAERAIAYHLETLQKQLGVSQFVSSFLENFLVEKLNGNFDPSSPNRWRDFNDFLQVLKKSKTEVESLLLTDYTIGDYETFTLYPEVWSKKDISFEALYIHHATNEATRFVNDEHMVAMKALLTNHREKIPFAAEEYLSALIQQSVKDIMKNTDTIKWPHEIYTFYGQLNESQLLPVKTQYQEKMTRDWLKSGISLEKLTLQDYIGRAVEAADKAIDAMASELIKEWQFTRPKWQLIQALKNITENHQISVQTLSRKMSNNTEFTKTVIAELIKTNNPSSLVPTTLTHPMHQATQTTDTNQRNDVPDSTHYIRSYNVTENSPELENVIEIANKVWTQQGGGLRIPTDNRTTAIKKIMDIMIDMTEKIMTQEGPREQRELFFYGEQGKQGHYAIHAPYFGEHTSVYTNVNMNFAENTDFELHTHPYTSKFKLNDPRLGRSHPIKEEFVDNGRFSQADIDTMKKVTNERRNRKLPDIGYGLFCLKPMKTNNNILEPIVLMFDLNPGDDPNGSVQENYTLSLYRYDDNGNIILSVVKDPDIYLPHGEKKSTP